MGKTKAKVFRIPHMDMWQAACAGCRFAEMRYSWGAAFWVAFWHITNEHRTSVELGIGKVRL